MIPSFIYPIHQSTYKFKSNIVKMYPFNKIVDSESKE